jgi:predicted Zn-dependent peptidase
MTRRVSFQIKHIHGYKFFFMYKPSNILHIEAVIHSGFIHETKQTAGVNHLLEHMLVSAWKECEQSCNTFWDKEGAYVNASTDDTTMNYYVKGNKEDEANMVEYISTIITHPLFRSSVMEREKKAVQVELLEALNNPITQVYDTFHKHFFSIEGLQHAEDCSLQLKNLKHLTLSTLKDAYDQFHSNNCLFLVYGDYSNAASLFEKHLTPRKGTKLPTVSCFSLKHDIIHIPFQKESVTLYLGFPCTETTSFYDHFELMLHYLLFQDLRTTHKLVYDIDVNVVTSRCGTVVTIELDVTPENAVKTFSLLLHYLQSYQTTLKDVNGVQKKVKYQYQRDYVVNYVSSFIHETGVPLSKRQLLQKVNEFTPEMFRKLCQLYCPLEKALCVYQGKKMNLSW